MRDNDWLAIASIRTVRESAERRPQTQLQPLMSLETATKSGERKKEAANNSGFTNSTTKTSG